LNQLELNFLELVLGKGQGIIELAVQLKVSEHEAVDIAERLLDAGLLSLRDDGFTVYKREINSN